MDIDKGRRFLSKNQQEEVNDLEYRLQKSKIDKKTKYTKSDDQKLVAYYKMIDYLGGVNG